MGALRLAVVLVLLVMIVLFIVAYTRDVKKARLSAGEKSPVDFNDIKNSFDSLATLKKTGKIQLPLALASFVGLLDKVQFYMPETLVTQLRTINTTAADLAERLDGNNVFSEERRVVYSTLVDYVPSIIKSYLDLPLALRIDDSEPTLIARDQLEKITVALSVIHESEIKKIVDELKIHAIFVEEKFQEYKNKDN